MNSKIIISGLLMLVMIATSSPAYSCSCAPTPPPAEAFVQADAVLLGKVIDIQKGPEEWYITAKISVLKTWKGKKDITVKIQTGSDGAMCGFSFQEGKTYLIYAYKTEDAQLGTNICTRTRLAEAADKDLTFLATQPGEAHSSGGCGSKNIFAGDIYLFVGALVYLLRRKAFRKHHHHVML